VAVVKVRVISAPTSAKTPRLAGRSEPPPLLEITPLQWSARLLRCHRHPRHLSLLGNTTCVSGLARGLLYEGKQSCLPIFHKRLKIVGAEIPSGIG
jgi:hypothetical protein